MRPKRCVYKRGGKKKSEGREERGIANDTEGPLITLFELGSTHKHKDITIYNQKTQTKNRTFYQYFLNPQDKYPSRLMMQNSKTGVRMTGVLATDVRIF